MPFDQSSRYRLHATPSRWALRTVSSMSATCCAGVLRSCVVRCLSDPFASTFITFPPRSAIQPADASPSVYPRISTRSAAACATAHRKTVSAPSRSPALTCALAISMRSTPTSSSTNWAMESFSSGV